MGRVKCIHCKKSIDQSAPTCPFCGAMNAASVGGTSYEDLRVSEPSVTPVQTEGAKRSVRSENVKAAGAKTARPSAGRVTAERGRKKGKKTSLPVVLTFLVISAVSSIFSGVQKQQQENVEVYEGDYSEEPVMGSYYYAQDQEILCYFEGYVHKDRDIVAEWWIYDEDTDDWSMVNTARGEFPDDISGSDEVKPEDLKSVLEWEDLSDGVDISKSHAYIDAGHHPEPDFMRYYRYEDRFYYFMTDYYSRLVGEENRTGWYRYEGVMGWQFYCKEDDHQKLGDEMWYNPGQYAICTQWSFSEEYAKKWGITDFQESIPAKKVEEARQIIIEKNGKK